MKTQNQQQQTSIFNIDYNFHKRFEPTILIRKVNSYSMSFKSHCSVISIHTIRERILLEAHEC